MPKGRILAKKISYDEKVQELTLNAALLYTWCIPHLDCEGRMYAMPSVIKGNVVPFRAEFTEKLIVDCLIEMEKVDLVQMYGKTIKYMEFVGFGKNQHIQKSKEAPSIIPTPEEFGINSRVSLRQVKESKVKESKGKYSSAIDEIVNDLNEVCGTDYKPETDKTRQLIIGRLQAGFTVASFKKVHRVKYKEWHSDEKMIKYLRPQTLYTSSNFESYLNQKEKVKRSWD